MLTHDEIWLAIDRLAQAHGYSPSGLAKQAGLDPTSFNKSKRISPDGKPRWPSTESISKVLRVTGATMNELIGFIEESRARPRAMSKDKMAQKAAKILLETKSVLFNAREPFTYTSGKQGPVYVDIRRLIAFPEARSTLMDLGAQVIKQKMGDLDYVAGGETAGIPYAAFLAERTKLPMLYVRKKPKGFGRMAQIEGALEKDKPRILLVEDMTTDGGSKRVFVDALRAAGATVEHIFVIFHYGIFPASEKTMKEMGVTLHSLCNWWDVLAVAKNKDYFDSDTLKSVEAFLNNPEGWSAP